MTRPPLLQRLAAFTDDPHGGNPAGVWIGDQLPAAGMMQAMAADIGYSETAFLAPRDGAERGIRYFSPQAEVSFCGHATIAAGVALGRDSGAGRYLLHTRAGAVPVQVAEQHGRRRGMSRPNPKSSPSGAGKFRNRRLSWARVVAPSRTGSSILPPTRNGVCV